MSNKKMKPHTNIFQWTKSQMKKNMIFIKDLPRSKYYRDCLEPLLGSVVRIKCDKWEVYSDLVDGKECDRLLLLESEIFKAPSCRNVTLPIKIQHIWTVVDKGWKTRNIFPHSCHLICKGFLYEYKSKDKKNIGFQALSIKPKENR